MDSETTNQILEITKFILPGVILPILILYLNNRHTRKIKELEQKFELDKEESVITLNQKGKRQNEKKEHEKEVYASLIKILFEIQKLNIELSGNCVDFDCLDKAISAFKDRLSIYQDKISDNQIYLNPEATNKLYEFYQEIGKLLIELKEIEDKEKYELALACVFLKSRIIALNILDLREIFEDVEAQKLTTEMKFKIFQGFITCCGDEPQAEIVSEYLKFNPYDIAKNEMVMKILTYGKVDGLLL
jgi:hypothetical protein